MPHEVVGLFAETMNNSSSWNCFSWNRRKCASNGERVSPRKLQDNSAEIPDEQFANLLGGECRSLSVFSFLISESTIMEFSSGHVEVGEQISLITVRDKKFKTRV